MWPQICTHLIFTEILPGLSSFSDQLGKDQQLVKGQTISGKKMYIYIEVIQLKHALYPSHPSALEVHQSEE